MSELFMPTLIAVIIIYGICKKTPMYDCFIDGAKDGLKTVVEIIPFIIAIFIGIEALTCSGAMDFFKSIFAPLTEAVGIPGDLISLILLRPVSGSGALVLAQDIMKTCGTDTLTGRAASVMVGSCETVFYVLALYFGVTAVKNIRHSLTAGIVGYLVGVFASVYICRFL